MHTDPSFAAPWMAPSRQPPRCVVCETALHHAVATDCYPTCHAVACRMVVSRRASMGEAGFRHYLQLQAQQRQQLAARNTATATRRVAEAAENAHAWNALQQFVSVQSDTMRLVLPSGPRRARPLALARRERYRAHLEAMAAEAAAITADAPAEGSCDTEVAATAAGSLLPGQLCGLCGGGCCTRGADHAYVSAVTLRRFMDAQPHLAAGEVVAAYLARLTGATQAGSCINHTRAGCSLPREMRSDICNRFACAPLAKVLTAQQGDPTVQVVLVLRRSSDHWRRADPALENKLNGAAVLRETGVQRMPSGRWRARVQDA
jgi:hypothetical protein